MKHIETKHPLLDVLNKRREHERERFEPLPLQIPLEPPHELPRPKSAEEKSPTSERGVWTIDL